MKYELSLFMEDEEGGQKISIEKDFNEEPCWTTIMGSFIDILKAAGYIFSEDTEYVLKTINGMNASVAAEALVEAEKKD